MYGQFLMTFEDNEIMPIALVVPEEEILAMDRINLLPVFQSQFYGRKRRMCMKIIAEAMFIQKGQDLGDSIVFHYLEMPFA